MSLFNEPIAPQRKPQPEPDNDKIVAWQVVYGDGPGAISREMNVMGGFEPPLVTQWNGQSYSRFFINRDSYSATYRKGEEARKVEKDLLAENIRLRELVDALQD